MLWRRRVEHKVYLIRYLADIGFYRMTVIALLRFRFFIVKGLLAEQAHTRVAMQMDDGQAILVGILPVAGVAQRLIFLRVFVRNIDRGIRHRAPVRPRNSYLDLSLGKTANSEVDSLDFLPLIELQDLSVFRAQG